MFSYPGNESKEGYLYGFTLSVTVSSVQKFALLGTLKHFPILRKLSICEGAFSIFL